MFRPVQISLAAAIAALVVLPAGIAYSTGVLTPKQAKLQGLVATSKTREQTVDKLIVKLRSPKSAALAGEMSAAREQSMAKSAGVGMKLLRKQAGGAHLMQLERAIPLSEARAMAARLAQDADVEYAEPNTHFRALLVPTETRYTQWQWNLFAPTSSYTDSAAAITTTATGGANLPPAWEYTTGSDSVVVAVIDSGIVNHPDLNGVAGGATYTPAGRFLPGYDFVSPGAVGLPANFVANDGNGRDADPSDPGDWITAAEKTQYPDECAPGETAPYQTSDSSWHGSHVAGVIAATANNGVGIAGIGWNVKILPVRALGKCGGDLSDIEEAIRWAAGLPVSGVPANPYPAKVINLSLGGEGACSSTMQAAVTAAIGQGAVIVAATGNGGDVNVVSPANCTGVIAVTAHAINGENAEYANIGTQTKLSAPGGGTPFQLGNGSSIDNANFDGYYIFSSVLFGATTPTSTSSAGSSSGPAYTGFVGTSAASPHVAGVAALLKSAVPDATPVQIEALLKNNTRPYPTGSACNTSGFAGMCGTGLLDAGKALVATGNSVVPAAAAGADQTAIPGSFVTLNGVNSKAFNGKTITGYLWEQVSGPAVTLNGASTVTANFYAPSTGTLVFRLTVTDSQGKTGTDQASVRVNSAPVLAVAPAARSATVGETVTFSVTATDADNDAITYAASSASNVPVTALSPSGVFSWNTTGYSAGTYTLAYFATDGLANSATQTVTITLTGGGSAANPPVSSGGGGGGSWNWAGIGLLLSLLLLRAATARQQRKRRA